ncbi:MAG: hypothetical protein LBS10_07485 [Gracilibacteraceae bacterium]|jgi:HPt (histidine-containing phosphotransfer) domain-containing protein|nr:hypothetical protein [Gracilibacteraceae bacterium]
MDKTVMAEILRSADLPGMDFARGLQRFNGNAEVYARILRVFVKNMPAALDRLRAVSPETLADYVILIHGLKGSCYGVNADAAGKLAENLEIAGKNGDLDYVLNNNAGFIQATEELLAGLEALFRSLDGDDGGKTRRRAPEPSLLRELLAASREYDIEAMERALNRLTQYEYESDPGLVPWLKEQADNFAYDAVREKLEELTGD